MSTTTDVGKIVFTVPGFARGQGRPRFTRFGAHGRAYKDKKDVEWEARIRSSYLASHSTRPPIAGPVRLRVLALYTPPKSWPKKKLATAFHKTSKPDLDNVVKSIKDALKATAWLDDAQVAEIAASKQYSDRDQVVVEITRL